MPMPKTEPERPVHRATPACIVEDSVLQSGWGWLLTCTPMRMHAYHSLHVGRDGADHAAEVVMCSEHLHLFVPRHGRSLDESSFCHLERAAADQCHRGERDD